MLDNRETSAQSKLQAAKPDRPRPRLQIPGLLREIIGTLVFIVAVTVLFDMAIPRSLVEGHSMEPTFFGEDRLVISRVNYLFGLPQRGNIVVFNSLQPREPGEMLIKRVVGMPGEIVSIRNATVWINDVQLDEPYILELCNSNRCRDNEWVLASDEYFLMGDNRNHSNDSRSFGPVSGDHIVGQVIFRYWPLPTFGIIS